MPPRILPADHPARAAVSDMRASMFRGATLPAPSGLGSAGYVIRLNAEGIAQSARDVADALAYPPPPIQRKARR